MSASSMSLQVDLLERRYLLSAGSLDLIFNQTGIVSTSFPAGPAQASAIVAQPDGKIVVVGSVGINTNSSEFALARYNRDGTLDSSFGTDGEVVTGFGSNLPAGANALLAQRQSRRR